MECVSSEGNFISEDEDTNTAFDNLRSRLPFLKKVLDRQDLGIDEVKMQKLQSLYEIIDLKRLSVDDIEICQKFINSLFSKYNKKITKVGDNNMNDSKEVVQSYKEEDKTKSSDVRMAKNKSDQNLNCEQFNHRLKHEQSKQFHSFKEFREAKYGKVKNSKQESTKNKKHDYQQSFKNDELFKKMFNYESKKSCSHMSTVNDPGTIKSFKIPKIKQKEELVKSVKDNSTDINLTTSEIIENSRRTDPIKDNDSEEHMIVTKSINIKTTKDSIDKDMKTCKIQDNNTSRDLKSDTVKDNNKKQIKTSEADYSTKYNISNENIVSSSEIDCTVDNKNPKINEKVIFNILAHPELMDILQDKGKLTKLTKLIETSDINTIEENNLNKEHDHSNNDELKKVNKCHKRRRNININDDSLNTEGNVAESSFKDSNDRNLETEYSSVDEVNKKKNKIKTTDISKINPQSTANMLIEPNVVLHPNECTFSGSNDTFQSELPVAEQNSISTTSVQPNITFVKSKKRRPKMTELDKLHADINQNCAAVLPISNVRHCRLKKSIDYTYGDTIVSPKKKKMPSIDLTGDDDDYLETLKKRKIKKLSRTSVKTTISDKRPNILHPENKPIQNTKLIVKDPKDEISHLTVSELIAQTLKKLQVDSASIMKEIQDLPESSIQSSPEKIDTFQHFSNSSDYQIHLNSCPFWQAEGYKCIFCPKMFKTSIYMTEHLKDHGPTRFRCFVCNYKTPTFRSISSHMKKNHNLLKLDFLPEDPKFHNLDKDAFIVQERKNLVPKELTDNQCVDSFNCGECSYKGNTQKIVVLHMKNFHNIDEYNVTPVDSSSKNNREYLVQRNKSVLIPRLRSSVKSECKNGSNKKGSPKAKINIQDNKKSLFFNPNTIDDIPKSHIFTEPVGCSLCTYNTKVRSNLIIHLNGHTIGEDNITKDIVNPVPSMGKSELAFDKMINLSASSFDAMNTIKVIDDEKLNKQPVIAANMLKQQALESIEPSLVPPTCRGIPIESIPTIKASNRSTSISHKKTAKSSLPVHKSKMFIDNFKEDDSLGSISLSGYFVCPRCNKFETWNIDHFREHLYKDVNYKTWKCMNCFEISDSPKKMAWHVKKHGIGIKYEKFEDNEKFNWVERVIEHQTKLIFDFKIQRAKGPEQNKKTLNSPSKKKNIVNDKKVLNPRITDGIIINLLDDSDDE